MIGIAAANRQWYLYRGNIDDIPEDRWLSEQNCTPVWVSTDKTVHGICFQDSGSIHTIPLDAAFPILHGKNGEDGTVQGLLELAGIPVIGCGLLSSAVGMDKELAHRIVSAAGIPTAATVTVTRPYSAEELMKCARRLGYPLFIKPVRAGSSFGITRVCEERELLPAVENAFAHDSEVVMEEEIRHAAAVIYRALKCRDFARIDMFLTPEGKIYFNEVNTIPGFTAHSRYPGMMKAAGIDFPELIRRLIEMGMGR